jgi:hypothetical protein
VSLPAQPGVRCPVTRDLSSTTFAHAAIRVARHTGASYRRERASSFSLLPDLPMSA